MKRIVSALAAAGAGLVAALSLGIAGSTAAGETFEVRKLAENASSITLGWDAQPGADGYRFYRDGTAVSRTFDPSRTSVKFAKGESYKIEVLILSAGASGVYPPPPPPPTTTAPPPTTTPPPVTTAPPPPPTTTEPPPTTTEPPPPPPLSGYPDASNTGVVNEAALTYWPGHEPGANPSPVYIQTDGAVIENKIFRRVVIVFAKNVTFRNVRFKHNSDYYMLLSEAGVDANIQVFDSEFDGMGAAQINAAVAGPGWTLTRVDIQGVQDGAKLQNNTNVYDSWIHNLWVTCDLGGPVPGDCDPHYDALQNLGGMGNIVKHNTLDVGVGRGRNGAVFMRGYCAGGCISWIGNVLIEDNRLLGGGWTVACCGPEPNLRYENIVIRNNKFGRHAYGPITTGGETNPAIVQRSGNVWDETATAGVPGQPIPGN